MTSIDELGRRAGAAALLDAKRTVDVERGLAAIGAGERPRLSTAPDGAPRRRWIAVAYSDWQTAGAPSPDDVLDLAVASPAIAGVLIDTFDKARAAQLGDSGWATWARRAKGAHLKLAVAGGLKPETIRDLAALKPDLVAVRGAACAGGERRADIDARRVADLAAVVRGLFAPS